MSVSMSARPLTADEDPRWIVSILPARGQGRQLGVVALDSDSATMRVSHLAADSPTYVNTVHLLAGATPPAVVLLPATSTTDPQVGMLVKALQANFPDATLVPVMRKYWNEQASARELPHSSVPRLDVLTRFERLSAPPPHLLRTVSPRGEHAHARAGAKQYLLLVQATSTSRA